MNRTNFLNRWFFATKPMFELVMHFQTNSFGVFIVKITPFTKWLKLIKFYSSTLMNNIKNIIYEKKNY